MKINWKKAEENPDETQNIKGKHLLDLQNEIKYLKKRLKDTQEGIESLEKHLDRTYSEVDFYRSNFDLRSSKYARAIFLKKYNLELCNIKDTELCPCRFKLKSNIFCNFIHMEFELRRDRGTLKYEHFLKAICKENRQLSAGPLTIYEKRILERIEQAVKWVENNEIKSGDIVYCTREGKDVIFLEKPPLKAFTRYHKYKKEGEKYPPFSGDVKYKTLNGEMRECAIACIVRISTCDFFSEYEIKGLNEISQNRLNSHENIARAAGFRVEKTETNSSYLLKIFGDSQEKVDDLVMCFQNDLMLI